MNTFKQNNWNANIGLFCIAQTYPGGLLICEDLRVDSVELQDEFVHQLCVQSPVSFEEGAVLHQLFLKTVCQQKQTERRVFKIKACKGRDKR